MKQCIICSKLHHQKSLTCSWCNNLYHPRNTDDPKLIYMKATFDRLSETGTLLNKAGHYPEIEKKLMQAIAELAHEILLLEH